MMDRWRVHGVVGMLAAVIGAVPAGASVQLITLPVRERVELQLDNPQVTLVEEERFVPLNAGVNDVVFGWAGAHIDKESIQFRCLSDPERIRVLSVSYPPGQNALTWQVAAPEATSARVRISYIISQLNRSFAYRAVASHDEKSMTLRQYIQLHNRANESFDSAGMYIGSGETFERPIGIHETKQLLANKFVDVPIQKTYTASLSHFGYLDAGRKQLMIPMHYVIRNDTHNGLGQFPLQPGKVRIFQEDGRGTHAFLGEDWGVFTPRDDEMRLYLGQARDVVVKRTIARREKKRVLGNLYNHEIVVQYEIDNFKDSAVTLDIVESMAALRAELVGNSGRDVDWTFGGDGTLRSMHDREKSTADELVFHVPLPARGADQKAVRQVQTMHVVIRNEW